MSSIKPIQSEHKLLAGRIRIKVDGGILGFKGYIGIVVGSVYRSEAGIKGYVLRADLLVSRGGIHDVDHLVGLGWWSVV